VLATPAGLELHQNLNVEKNINKTTHRKTIPIILIWNSYFLVAVWTISYIYMYHQILRKLISVGNLTGYNISETYVEHCILWTMQPMVK
jgi:hypothetical protein